jgi:hypothetical protein
MNYTKPEVTALGQAVRVIEGQPKGFSGPLDGGVLPNPNRQIAAYHLDE